MAAEYGEFEQFEPELIGKVVEVYGRIGDEIVTVVGTLQAYATQHRGVGFRLVGDNDATIFNHEEGDEIYSIRGGYDYE